MAGRIEVDLGPVGIALPDLAADLVEQMQATYAFRANLRTIEAEKRMSGSLLDIQA